MKLKIGHLEYEISTKEEIHTSFIPKRNLRSCVYVGVGGCLQDMSLGFSQGINMNNNHNLKWLIPLLITVIALAVSLSFNVAGESTKEIYGTLKQQVDFNAECIYENGRTIYWIESQLTGISKNIDHLNIKIDELKELIKNDFR
jgi:hypothetical protein